MQLDRADLKDRPDLQDNRVILELLDLLANPDHRDLKVLQDHKEAEAAQAIEDLQEIEVSQASLDLLEIRV